MTVDAVPAVRTHSRRVIVPVMLTVACVVAVSVAVWLTHRPAGDQPAAADGELVLSSTPTAVGDVVLRLPETWQFVEPTFATAALVQPVGWIINAEPGPQCTPMPPAEHITCHAPVTDLDDGQVVVFVAASGYLLGGDFTANTTFAGLAALETETDGSSCVAGRGADGIDLVAKDGDGLLYVHACLAASSPPGQSNSSGIDDWPGGEERNLVARKPPLPR